MDMKTINSNPELQRTIEYLAKGLYISAVRNPVLENYHAQIEDLDDVAMKDINKTSFNHLCYLLNLFFSKDPEDQEAFNNKMAFANACNPKWDPPEYDKFFKNK